MHYFSGKLPHGFSALYISEIMLTTVSGLLGVFTPIFLFELFNQNLYQVLMWYLLSNLIYIFAVAHSARLLHHIGFKLSLQISTLFGALIYACFYIASPENVHYIIPISLISLVIWKMLFWLPYHIEFVAVTDRKNRGRQMGIILATAGLLGIVTPIISGYVISKFTIDILFIVASILFLGAAIPYNFIPDSKQTFEWTYRETWVQFFSKKNRPLVLSVMGQGAEVIIGALIWPIFIFQLLDGNYFEVGALSTLIVGVTVILQLGTGDIIDKHAKKEKVIRIASILYAIGWIIKIFVVTGFHIFAIGIYHNAMSVFTKTPFNTLIYDITADQGRYIDEFTTIKEMSICAGKSIAILLALVTSLFLPLQGTFIIGAIGSLLLNYIYSEKISLNN